MALKSRFLLAGLLAAASLLLSAGIALAHSTATLPNPIAVAESQALESSLVPVAQATPSGGMFTAHDRLARPHLSDPPTQLELGHREFWMSCMICHGDRGQGLTEEWRQVLDPADQNCWQSRCHAANHPPEGFQVPREAPMIIGTGALAGYPTAADLHEYLRVEMPWAFPGLFDDKKYWELTAYLLKANNIDLGKEDLGPDNSRQIFLVPALVQTHRTGHSTERLLAGGLVFLLLGALLARRWTRDR
jgi:hypothetical protein